MAGCAAGYPAIACAGPDTAPAVRSNHIHDNEGSGVYCADGASPLVEGNDVCRCQAGVRCLGRCTRPAVRGNVIHDNQDGILVGQGAAPELEENQFHDNRGHDYRAEG